MTPLPLMDTGRVQTRDLLVFGQNQTEKVKFRAGQNKSSISVAPCYRGVVHSEYLPSGQTGNKDYYLAVVKHLRDTMRRKKQN